MADRLYVFTSRQIIEAVLRSVPAPPWEEIDSAEFRAAENGGVVTVYLKRIPALADPNEPGTVKECSDPVHELLKSAPHTLQGVERAEAFGHAPPDPAVHSIDRYAAQTAESPEVLYQTLRLYVDPVEHAPTLAQIRKWSSEEQIAAARWVTVEHAHNSPIAGHELPEREAIPIHVSQAIVERRAELERLRSPELTGTSAKPAKKKRGGK